MQQVLNKKLLFLGLLIFGFFKAGFAKAVCSVCIVAVSGGVGLCRWIGVDDTISGVWIGALILSMIIWTINWMNKKNIHFFFRNKITYIAYYVLVIWPLYSTNIMGHPLNTVLGMDKILFGIILGTILLLLGVFINGALKKKNGGKAYFAFQKVVIPVILLILASLILHFIIKCNIKLPWIT